MTIGLICAMQLEADGIIAEMSDVAVSEISGLKFWDGKIGDTRAVVCVCGIGKVFAGMCAQTLILKFKPDAIINVGVAGSLTKKLGLLDVIVATDVCEHDMDTSPIGDPVGLISGLNKVYMEASEPMSQKLCDIANELGIHAIRGRIATGDQFIDSEEQRTRIKEQFGAHSCEMEGGAVAQVCLTNGVPFALLRAISDSETCDYMTFANKAAANSAKVCISYLKSI